MEKIDLHLHTIYSDGTDDLDELLEKLQEKEITCFSVTDHDTVAGSTAMLKKTMPEGMTFISGVEFSCVTAAGEKCHILGYGYDPDSPSIQDIVQLGASKRREKLEMRLNGLKERFGIEFSEKDLTDFRAMESVGKPHIARVMIRMGIASDKDEAIQKYLNPIKTLNTRLDAETVIKAINASGGISVWAHPLGGEGEKHLTEDAFKTELSHMIDYGIQGLECWYSRFNESEIQLLLDIAKENDLLISGGSDYHGKNKNVVLGTLNNYGRAVDRSELMIPRVLKA